MRVGQKRKLWKGKKVTDHIRHYTEPGMNDIKNECVARFKKLTGKSTHAISAGRTTQVYRKGPDGQYRWYTTRLGKQMHGA